MTLPQWTLEGLVPAKSKLKHPRLKFIKIKLNYISFIQKLNFLLK